MTEWNGFRAETFTFMGRNAIVVFPPETVKTNKWLLKTEYFDAFPQTEIALAERGFHLAFLSNINRWGLKEDLDAKAAFADYLKETYGLADTCVPVGMSCGGLFAIKFAAAYPEKVSVLYLDAPVVNLLSCPCRLGIRKEEVVTKEEMYAALGLNDVTVLSYRDHPLDKLPVLIEKKIPAVLVYGDADSVVYPEENAALVIEAYRNTGIPFEVHVKPGGDHHPHGLEDPTEVIRFIEEHA